MTDRKGKPSASAPEPTGATSILERRRIGKVVHDERGNATLEWVEAPTAESERPALSLEETQPHYKPESGYNPYEKNARGLKKSVEQPARPVKRDLRKLGEWIKQMRELEERRRRGDADDADDDKK